MNKIKQHIPASIDGDRLTIEFNTQKELMNIPFVKNFSKLEGFYRYSISSSGGFSPLLMCELRDGYDWWVVGFIDSMDGINLPEWKEKYE